MTGSSSIVQGKWLWTRIQLPSALVSGSVEIMASMCPEPQKRFSMTIPLGKPEPILGRVLALPGTETILCSCVFNKLALSCSSRTLWNRVEYLFTFTKLVWGLTKMLHSIVTRSIKCYNNPFWNKAFTSFVKNVLNFPRQFYTWSFFLLFLTTQASGSRLFLDTCISSIEQDCPASWNTFRAKGQYSNSRLPTHHNFFFEKLFLIVPFSGISEIPQDGITKASSIKASSDEN